MIIKPKWLFRGQARLCPGSNRGAAIRKQVKRSVKAAFDLDLSHAVWRQRDVQQHHGVMWLWPFWRPARRWGAACLVCAERSGPGSAARSGKKRRISTHPSFPGVMDAHFSLCLLIYLILIGITLLARCTSRGGGGSGGGVGKGNMRQ